MRYQARISSKDLKPSQLQQKHNDIYEIFRHDLVLNSKPAKPFATEKQGTSTVPWLKLSKAWDFGSKQLREKILQEFIRANKNKTGPQLERDFGNSASLFLVRLTSWLRLTYLLGYNLRLQFDALNVFLSASSGQRFLLEFMEVGGVLTTLEVLGLSKINDVGKAAALRLLLNISLQGRKYKEFICESYGVRAVTDCLLRSTNENTQNSARNLLYHLGNGNPKYLNQVFKSLLTIVTSKMASPSSQQLAGQAVRLLIPSVDHVQSAVVDASIALLRSVHIQVQYEGYEILRDLLSRSYLQEQILNQLISLLTITVDDYLDDSFEAKQNRHPGMVPRRRSISDNGIQPQRQDDVALDELEATTATYVQQSYAAKLLGVMSATYPDLCEKMMHRQVVSALLCAIGNTKYPDSQRYAANTVLFLTQKYPAIQKAIEESMGHHFWQTMDTQPDTFFAKLTKEQVKALKRNQIVVQVDSSGQVTTTSNVTRSESSIDESDNDESDHVDATDQTQVVNADMQAATDDESGETEKNQDSSEAESTEEVEVDVVMEATVTRTGVTADSLYTPLAGVSVNKTLANTQSSEEENEDNYAIKFANDLEAIKENAKQNRVLAKLGVDRKNEMELSLNVQGSERLSKVIDRAAFRTDVQALIKDLVSTAPGEESKEGMFADKKKPNSQSGTTDGDSEIRE